jgi:hypothetical protein
MVWGFGKKTSAASASTAGAKPAPASSAKPMSAAGGTASKAAEAPVSRDMCNGNCAAGQNCVLDLTHFKGTYSCQVGTLPACDASTQVVAFYNNTTAGSPSLQCVPNFANKDCSSCTSGLVNNAAESRLRGVISRSLEISYVVHLNFSKASVYTISWFGLLVCFVFLFNVEHCLSKGLGNSKVRLGTHGCRKGGVDQGQQTAYYHRSQCSGSFDHCCYGHASSSETSTLEHSYLNETPFHTFITRDCFAVSADKTNEILIQNDE